MKNDAEIDYMCRGTRFGRKPKPPVGSGRRGFYFKAQAAGRYSEAGRLLHRRLQPLPRSRQQGVPHLKWLDLREIAERLLPNRRDYRVVRIYYVSAKKPDDVERSERHQQYINALKYREVECELGHFVTEVVVCNGCGRKWNDDHEKESDINLALAVLDDAHRNVFDEAYIITANSDQAATARMMRRRFPDKRLVAVMPPGMEPSKAIKTHTAYRQTLTTAMIEEAHYPKPSPAWLTAARSPSLSGHHHMRRPLAGSLSAHANKRCLPRPTLAQKQRQQSSKAFNLAALNELVDTSAACR